jgi:hypothetical protein
MFLLQKFDLPVDTRRKLAAASLKVWMQYIVLKPLQKSICYTRLDIYLFVSECYIWRQDASDTESNQIFV